MIGCWQTRSCINHGYPALSLVVVSNSLLQVEQSLYRDLPTLRSQQGEGSQHHNSTPENTINVHLLQFE